MTNSYEFTWNEVDAIRFALLALRARGDGKATRLTDEQIVELENKLFWKGPKDD